MAESNFLGSIQEGSHTYEGCCSGFLEAARVIASALSFRNLEEQERGEQFQSRS